MTCRAGHASCHPMPSCHSMPSCHYERHTLSFRSEARNLEQKPWQSPGTVLQILHFVQDDKSGCVQDGRKHRSG